MEKDFNNMPPFMDFSMFNQFGQGCNTDMNDIYKDPMFNPMMQYEQAYCYYKCLCMQMDYKIKCKEYEKMCNSNSNNEKVQRRVE
ncbi:MAG: hypothetical protein HFJ59_01125 [Clostridia bacterium]|nr:hypothetical protein [Clostridia bacterium]